MKKILIVFICIFEFSCSSRNNSGTSGQSTVPALNKSLAAKPPMGWNSWDCLGWDANESEVKAAADI